MEFFRGKNNKIDNFLSCFGDIRETRITAYISYLFYLQPEIVNRLFEIIGKIKSLNLEISEEKSRSKKRSDTTYSLQLKITSVIPLK